MTGKWQPPFVYKVSNNFIKILINVDMTCQLKEKKSWIKPHSHVTHVSYIWFKLEEIPKERDGDGAQRWLVELQPLWRSLAMEEGGSQVEVKTVRVRDFQFEPNVPHVDGIWVKSNSIFFFLSWHVTSIFIIILIKLLVISIFFIHHFMAMTKMTKS